MAFYGWLMEDKERNSWKLTRPLFHWICNPMLIKFGICNPVPINVDYKSTRTNQRIANQLEQVSDKSMRIFVYRLSDSNSFSISSIVGKLPRKSFGRACPNS